MQNQIEIYRSSDGQTQIEVTFEQDTVWLTNSQMVEVFESSKANISEHIKHIFKSGELNKKATVRKFRTVQKEGHRLVERDRVYYNLDVIIAVGYRVNSKRGTQFRQWATQRLKEYLVQGYTINEKRLAQKQLEVQTLKDGIRILNRVIEEKISDTGFAWLSQFAKGLELLDDYDHEELDSRGLSERPAVFPEMDHYRQIIDVMKADFNSAVFGKERDGSFQSAVIQISKGFGNEDFYPSIEEKAATLLYLVIKNHGFVDGTNASPPLVSCCSWERITYCIQRRDNPSSRGSQQARRDGNGEKTGNQCAEQKPMTFAVPCVS